MQEEDRTSHAVQTIGTWLKPLRHQVAKEATELERALEKLATVPEGGSLTWPNEDARFDRLIGLIEEQLRVDNAGGPTSA